MLRHTGLNEKSGAARVKAYGEPIGRNFQRVPRDVRGISVISRERVPISNEKEAFVPLLQLEPVLERTDEVPQVKLAGGAHAT
jgi:hypothetical protein